MQAQLPGIQVPIVQGERLSDWLLRNAGPGADTTSLHWQVSAERARQGQLRQAVVQGLKQYSDPDSPAEARQQLSEFLMSLPLTGRLTTASADARWLQSAPAQDPILQEGHRVILLPRPSTVTVMSETGQPCLVRHGSGALIKDYLRACSDANNSPQADWAWIVQPDGRTFRYGVAPWSLEPQTEPAPGAWIWAPGRRSDIAQSVSDNLARFLATQLPGESTLPSSLTMIRPVTAREIGNSLPRSAQLTASDWGEIGLLQTPTARMAPAGDARMQVSRVQPYTRGTVMFQPLDWLEAGFRYSNISNRLYGPAELSGGQSFKDKSVDLKLRIRQETALWPQLAVGFRDFGGTGLFSSEYLVANKRWGNWDASLGLGWGYLAARGDLKNPLSVFGKGFNTRTIAANATGGKANLGGMFHGPAAIFGGVQWHSPSDPWIFKLERDGNSYQREPFGNTQPVKSQFNFGAVYRYSPNVDLSAGLERGNRLMVSFTLHGGLNDLSSRRLLDPALPAVRPDAPLQLPPSGWGRAAQDIELYTGWSVRSISHQNASTTVQIEADTAVYFQERIDRAVTVLHREAPATSSRFVLKFKERGLAASQVDVDRAEWVAQHIRPEPPSLRLPAQRLLPGQPGGSGSAVADSGDGGFWKGRGPGLGIGLGPSYSQTIGGPDGFVLYQFGLQATLEHRFSDSTWLSSAVGLRLLDNYGKFKYTAPSDLPRVRTFQREFATTARATIPLLQMTHVSDQGGGHYFGGYAGMLESMYGGAGAEWLYRPWQGRLALGVDVNRVRQRDFRQNLAFRNYSTNTGHATLYWDTGWNNLQANLSAGRYLAGDVGATLDVKRIFSNGVALGAYATKTNVSAAKFGEGSFDKGIYVTFPFDAILPKSTTGNGTIAWSPLTRDGGARLSRRFPLYDLTSQRDRRTFGWRAANQASASSAEDTTYVLGEPPLNGFETLGSSAGTLVQQISAIPGSTWLWAGGTILASSLLDKPVDKWARNHQGANLNRISAATNAVPLALALGAGALYTGIGGEFAANTAEIALKAATYTLGLNSATRYVVGRARPRQELGSSTFNGFTSSALQSGFASNHVSVAFALVTPFAQRHDMPWLYGVAAASAFGRVQKRDHWISDTVAGALLGYGIGSLVNDQNPEKTGMRLSVTPQSVMANWTFR